jgi:hypothetical protein
VWRSLDVNYKSSSVKGWRDNHVLFTERVSRDLQGRADRVERQGRESRVPEAGLGHSEVEVVPRPAEQPCPAT